MYGLDKLSVKITSEGTNWWGQNVTKDVLKDYAHQDRLGSTTNLTDKFGRVVGRADYNEWGETTYREALSITSSYRRIWPQSSYTGHDWDDVLGMYYAKARFYSAEDKRFVAMDPVKGSITDPMSLVPYVYCVDDPLRWVDPLGQVIHNAYDDAVTNGRTGSSNNAAKTPKAGTKFTVTKGGQKLYPNAGGTGSNPTSLAYNSTVTSLGTAVNASGDIWYYVSYGTGANKKIGWIKKDCLKETQTTNTSSAPKPVEGKSSKPNTSTPNRPNSNTQVNEEPTPEDYEFVENVLSYLDFLTSNLTDSVRRKDFINGMIIGIVNSVGTGVAINVFTFANLLSGIFPECTEQINNLLNDALTSMQMHENIAADIATHKDSFYLGKTAGDVISIFIGKSIATGGTKLIEHGGSILAGSALVTATGQIEISAIAALAGSVEVALGAEVVVAGAEIMAVAATAAADDYGTSLSEYQQKLACDKFQEKWENLLSKCTKRNNTKGSTHVYTRDKEWTTDAEAFETAKADFDSLGLKNVTSTTSSNGHMVYIGYTPNEQIVNLHFSSYEQVWSIEFGHFKIRY